MASVARVHSLEEFQVQKSLFSVAEEGLIVEGSLVREFPGDYCIFLRSPERLDELCEFTGCEVPAVFEKEAHAPQFLNAAKQGWSVRPKCNFN